MNIGWSLCSKGFKKTIIGEKLTSLVKDRNLACRVVCPIIDIIDSETMRYVESPVCKGGFNWGLTFKWDYPHRSYFENKQNFIKPMK